MYLKGVNAHLEAHEYGNADLHEFIAKLTEAGAHDLDNWSEQWLRTSGLDTITAERTQAGIVLRRTSPDSSRRPHRLSVRGYDADGSAATVDVMIEGDVVEVALSNDLIVPDADDDTWAKIRLDATSLASLPAVLPKIADGTTRAVIWNSIRDATAHAELDPRQALELFVTAIQHEDSDVAVGSLVRWLEERMLGGYLPYDESRAAVADALGNKLATTEPGSSLQLATVRGFIATTSDAELLKAWLSGDGTPDGLEIDADLRWALVLRLVRLNVFGAAEIDAELARDTSTEGVNHAARCRSALPDGKEAAWTRIMTDPTIGVKELLAAAEGFWHPGQAAVTAPYVERFFTDIHRTAEIRSGMVVPLTVHRIVPEFVIEPEVLVRAEALVADETVAPSIRRQTANFADNLRKAVVVRRTYG